LQRSSESQNVYKKDDLYKGSKQKQHQIYQTFTLSPKST
jgi:hypothetical protein